MSIRKILVLVIFFASFCAQAQVKIGQNPNSINSASIVELESTDKAFVLTRLTTAQMQAIAPLNGAVVYNTDTQCVHYYDGTSWINLCDGNTSSSFSFADNGDGSITLSDGNGNNVTFNGAPEIITTLTDNGDGTFTYTNEDGAETVISVASTDIQLLETDNTPGNIGISNGTTLNINVDDADADDRNEIQSLQFSGGLISLTNDPDATVIDLAGFDNDVTDDFSGDFGDLAGVPINLTTIIANTSGTNTGDQDISGIGTNATNITTNVSDIDALEAEQVTQNDAIAINSLKTGITTAEASVIANTSGTNTGDQDIIGAETNNAISVGANGGAFYESPIKAFGKIAADGSVTKATAGVTATRINTGLYEINLPAGAVSDANYIIQLSQPGRGGAGNDDPGISYEQQTTTSFRVIVGDNDNGGTDRFRFDSEFMFTILDL